MSIGPLGPSSPVATAGARFSALTEITSANVEGLNKAWTFSTGDLSRRPAAAMKRTKFETTPVLVDGRLILCTPFNEVIALDPGDGHALWRHDPEVSMDMRPANRFNCRGVAPWRDPASATGDRCATRILSATNDARLIALDAHNGLPCPGFGDGGQVRIDTGSLRWAGEFQVTSAPVVVRDTVIIGSAIGDNQRVDAPSGRVRAFDARTGMLRWTWDPLRPDASGRKPRAGAANVWAPMAVDEARGLVFLPTSSPSPDFFGGERPGDNRDADSVVALRVADGSRAWAFQVVKHDVWDYDVAAQPALATLHIDGRPRDVVVEATKQGLVFVLDRDTGLPVFPVEERPVPQGAVPGDVLSATQTFPVGMPALVPSELKAQDAFGFTFFDRGACRDRIAALRNEGLYTPPSTQGTVLFPSTGGGVNWGGVAIDPNDVVYVNTSRFAHAVTLIPREAYADAKAAAPAKEINPQTGAPFGMRRELIDSPFGAPCNPPPWGTLAALDLRTRTIRWEVPLGTTEEALPLGIALKTGMPNFGGPIVTAGGLVFIGAAMDRYLRAFDASSGAELWRGRLPAPAMAIPMTYEWKGRQYVVVAAGGHSEAGTKIADAVVAFRLPAPGESPRSVWDRTIDQPGGRFAAGAGAAVLAVVAAALWFARRRARRRRRSADRR
ncbi:MAG: pyrroloquinoline quinone-dependent dehydrogenase [Gammaproteobacteria bacterium]|nr:pyrroloquinoline quinone-dependent dehydrogenase [Gammaproteobacteria bacterium]MBU1444110.1 pyrroloquinoline quinone-dependent dehydrogenase [Gammaproteobacteria bacterium]